MKIKTLILLCLILVSCFTNCSKSDEVSEIQVQQLDDQFLEEESLSFNTYENVEKVIFIDENDTEYEFLLESYQKELIEHSVSTTVCGQEQTTEYRGEKISVRFQGPDSLRLHFNHTVQFLEGEKELNEDRLVDFLSFNVYHRYNDNYHNMGRGNFITSNRGGSLKEEDYGKYGFSILEMFTIAERTFDQVYLTDGITVLFNPVEYNKEFGILSFVLGDYPNFYEVVVDRLE